METLRKKSENDHEGTRTLNLLIRSQTPYPLGHAVPWWKVQKKLIWRKEIVELKKGHGDAGIRTPDLLHAKQALYH